MPLLAAPKSPVVAGWVFCPNKEGPEVVPNAGVLNAVAGLANDDCPNGVVVLAAPKPAALRDLC